MRCLQREQGTRRPPPLLLRQLGRRLTQRLQAGDKLPLNGCALDAQEPSPRKKNCFAPLVKYGYIAIAQESRGHHASISSSFICVACSLKASQATIAELRDEICSLKAELSSLKNTLSDVQQRSSLPYQTTTGPVPSALAANSKFSGGAMKNTTRPRTRETAGSSLSSATRPNRSCGSQGNTERRSRDEVVV